MAEYWEAVHIRGQQTIGVWTTFAPDFAVGELTSADHTADVAGILTRVNERDVQQDAVDAAVAARDNSFEEIHGVNTRAPQLIDAVLPPDDDLQDELDGVYEVDAYSHEGNLERGRRLISLWNQVNAKRAALTPPQPPLLLGSADLAALQSAVENHPSLLQTVANERAELSRKRSQLSSHTRKVDRDNKRWYAAWRSNFPDGSPEHDALSLVDTEEGASPPTALEIAALTQREASVEVTYLAGGGRRATSLTLVYQLEGLDPDFAHPAPVTLTGQTLGPFAAGQTIHVKTQASNSAGTTEGAVQSLTLAS